MVELPVGDFVSWAWAALKPATLGVLNGCGAAARNERSRVPQLPSVVLAMSKTAQQRPPSAVPFYPRLGRKAQLLGEVPWCAQSIMHGYFGATVELTGEQLAEHSVADPLEFGGPRHSTGLSSLLHCPQHGTTLCQTVYVHVRLQEQHILVFQRATDEHV